MCISPHQPPTLTLALIGRDLIEPRLLSADEIAWLDNYNLRVFGALSACPTLKPEERAWLAHACRPLVG